MRYRHASVVSKSTIFDAATNRKSTGLDAFCTKKHHEQQRFARSQWRVLLGQKTHHLINVELGKRLSKSVGQCVNQEFLQSALVQPRTAFITPVFRRLRDGRRSTLRFSFAGLAISMPSRCAQSRPRKSAPCASKRARATLKLRRRSAPSACGMRRSKARVLCGR